MAPEKTYDNKEYETLIENIKKVFDLHENILWIVKEKVEALQDSVEQVYLQAEEDYKNPKKFLEEKDFLIKKLEQQIRKLEVTVRGK